MGNVQIREFEPGDEAAFRRLNLEWIIRHFELETKDETTFADPCATILHQGGRIFFAVRQGEPVGCGALIPLAVGEYEVAKMAVTSTAQGSGIGRLMLQAAVDAARTAGATRLYLETNHALLPAIHLYESLGFRHLPPERVKQTEYKRADVFLEWIP